MEAGVRPLKTTEKLPELVDKYWKNVWEKKRDGKLVAWCSGSGPFELLKAMDIEVVWPESYGGLCAVEGISTNNVKELTPSVILQTYVPVSELLSVLSMVLLR